MSNDSDLDQVLAGHCIHGHLNQKDCMTCLLTRYMLTTLRRLLRGMFR